MTTSEFSRRGFLLAGAASILAAKSMAGFLAADQSASSGIGEEMRRYLLANLRMSPKEIDAFVAGKMTDQRNRQYDPVLGYISAAGRYRHGIDGAVCTYTYEANGARTMAAYAGRPCRINTYGDSFTECAQVSDGETWQERLAAHLGEPVRNFGVGSYSVYQAYLRMVQKEALYPAKYAVFNIFSEDHYRSLKPMVTPPYPRDRHSSPIGIRPYISANAAKRTLVAHPNPCPTPESLRHLSDSDWLWRTLGGEEEIALLFARSMEARHPSERYYPTIRTLAAARNYARPVESRESALAALDAMETADALYSSMEVIGWVEKFAAEHGKRILLVLSQSEDRVRAALSGQERFDRPFVDHLLEKGLPFLDMLEVHRRDFANFKVSPGQYASRFYVASNDNTYGPDVFGRYFGHYTPLGNEFQAFALKDRLVALLEPKPPAYQSMRMGDIY